MAEGIIDDTVEVVERYPVWILGGVLAAVLLFWWLSGSSAPANAGQPFTFSYGPSDAQVTAGAAEQVAQTQAMRDATVAQTQATAETGIYGGYFDYLATNSANSLAATQSTNDVTQALGLAGIQGQTDIASAQAAASAAASAAVQVANANAISQTNQAYWAAQGVNSQANAAGYIAQQQAASAANQANAAAWLGAQKAAAEVNSPWFGLNAGVGT